MASFNKVIIMGNVTRDVQLKYTPSNTAVCEIGLAINRSWFDKQSNSRKDEVTFVDVTLWGRTAEVAGEYLAKGRSCLIEGRLETQSWNDKESGQKRTKLAVVGETLQLLGDGRRGGAESSPGASSPASRSAGGAIDDEDVPF